MTTLVMIVPCTPMPLFSLSYITILNQSTVASIVVVDTGAATVSAALSYNCCSLMTSYLLHHTRFSDVQLNLAAFQ